MSESEIMPWFEVRDIYLSAFLVPASYPGERDLVKQRRGSRTCHTAVLLFYMQKKSTNSENLYSGWLHPVARTMSNRNNEPSFATVYKCAFY
jgi:hypothetical protein